ncbi:MAG TPA: hypothetical protein DCS93_31760 [Microscillaceae bacterium]|nr:hypothetical protein [Microscillaceae bacterium]
MIGNQNTITHLFDFATSNSLEIEESNFSATLHYWQSEPLSFNPLIATTYTGFVLNGNATIRTSRSNFTLEAGMYFSLAEAFELSTDGTGFLVAQNEVKNLFQIGGPIEEKGRLQYIDGCTDTLLISPVILGNPCLNLLHIPPQVFQSQHTHPSFRVGIIVSGKGACITPEETFELHPGQVFYIPKDSIHSFKTTDQALRVIAYHPDSDFGPTHEDHPMINRTILS